MSKTFPARKALELTLAILKPDLVANPVALCGVRQLLLDNHFLFVRSQEMHLTRTEAQKFYAEHKSRFFYNRLVNHMCSGPLCAHVLARHDAISGWRELMGPTRVFKTIYEAPDTIRGLHGLTDTRNATHGSDSRESALRETEFFFPEFDIDEWMREEEPVYRRSGSHLFYNNMTKEHFVMGKGSPSFVL